MKVTKNFEIDKEFANLNQIISNKKYISESKAIELKKKINILIRAIESSSNTNFIFQNQLIELQKLKIIELSKKLYTITIDSLVYDISNQAKKLLQVSLESNPDPIEKLELKIKKIKNKNLLNLENRRIVYLAELMIEKIKNKSKSINLNKEKSRLFNTLDEEECIKVLETAEAIFKNSMNSAKETYKNMSKSTINPLEEFAKTHNFYLSKFFESKKNNNKDSTKAIKILVGYVDTTSLFTKNNRLPTTSEINKFFLFQD